MWVRQRPLTPEQHQDRHRADDLDDAPAVRRARDYEVPEQGREHEAEGEEAGEAADEPAAILPLDELGQERRDDRALRAGAEARDHPPGEEELPAPGKGC